MKTKSLRLMALSVIVLAGTIVLSCTQTNNTVAPPKAAPCTTNGTTVNIGGSNGTVYATQVGVVGNNYYSLLFDNTDLNLSINGGPNNPGGAIMSAGGQNCLDFTYTGTPTAPSVALGDGAGYVGQFSDRHIVKFIVNSYHDGVANISYIFQ